MRNDRAVRPRMPEVASLLVSPVEQDVADDIERLFRSYAPYVARIGLRLLGRRDEVEDLVQEVFMAALVGVGKLRDPGAVKPWLAAIAVRKARGQLRRRRLLRCLGLDGDHDYEEVADAGASPGQRQLLARVFSVLDQMSADLRVAWSLRYLDGEELAAIAEMCCCSLSTVKRRIELAHAVVVDKVRGER
jgi:RNA polymerase sigma-70 factor (ECF subfamily)